MTTRRRPTDEPSDVSRRDFLETTAATLAVAAAVVPALDAQASPGQLTAAPARSNRPAVGDPRDDQRHGPTYRCRRSLDARRTAARSPWPDRHQDRVRPRRMRRVHRAHGRQAGVPVQSARRVGRWPIDRDDRERRGQWTAERAAAVVRGARRASVRLLHAGPCDERYRAAAVNARRRPRSRRAPR